MTKKLVKKMPTSGWHLFVKEYKSKHDMTSMTPIESFKKCGNMWMQLTEDKKKEYGDMARVLNEEAFVSKLDDKEPYELIKKHLRDKYTQEEIHKMYNTIKLFPFMAEVYTKGEVIALYPI